jgi:hypothetical protein
MAAGAGFRRPRLMDAIAGGIMTRPQARQHLHAGGYDGHGTLRRRPAMPATLKLTHKAIGAEVRRGPYHVVVDGAQAGSVEMNHTIEIPVESGRHTLQVRNGRNSSSTETFDAAEDEIVAFRCTGKRFLPIFLASFVAPRLALKLVRD